MPELRKDPVNSNWVIISAERGARPCDYKVVEEEADDLFCPFCPGHEENTPSPHKIYYAENGKAKLRVVPNKYPVLADETHTEMSGSELFEKKPGAGVHDIIIEHPDHYFTFFKAKAEDIELVWRAVRDRMQVLKEHPVLKHSMYFKNYKHAAGATLVHPHSQMISTPIMAESIRRELKGAMEHYEDEGACVFCRIIEEELRLKERVICESEHFAAFSPFAARQAFETAVYPKRHIADFYQLSDEELKDFAILLKELYSRIFKTLEDVPYNYFLHSAPYKEEGQKAQQSYHWHLEIIPKLAKLAGFEWGSGIYVNSIAPEDSAKALREAL